MDHAQRRFAPGADRESSFRASSNGPDMGALGVGRKVEDGLVAVGAHSSPLALRMAASIMPSMVPGSFEESGRLK